VLALVALLALLAQPVCEAYEAQVGDAATCCMSVDEAPAPAFSAVFSLGGKPPSVAIASVPGLAPHLSQPYPRTKAPPNFVLAHLPYHSRSARNLS